MSLNGEHLVCEKHSKAKRYSPEEKQWTCLFCELEEAGLETS